MPTIADRLPGLQARFLKLTEQLATGLDRTPTIPFGWFDILRGLYIQPGRHYHTLAHVANLLERLDAFVAARSEHEGWRDRVLQVEIAIWFHDAIYRMPAGAPGSNEVSSTLLAMSFLTTLDVVDSDLPGAPLVAHDFRRQVYEAIEATIHDVRDLGPNFSQRGKPVAQLMVDLDLAGFSDPWERFEENNRAIRLEFSTVSDEAYKTGRMKFLAGLLARPQIFWLLHDLEQPARRNIERHMSDLLRLG